MQLKHAMQEFPRDPVVKTRHFHCRGPGSIPGLRTKITQALQCGQSVNL